MYKPMPELEIIHQDDHLVAINKPSGLLVHRSKVDRHETRLALQMLRDQLQQHVYPVHRLDKPTSGVLLFALTPDIARAVSEQFANQAVTKRYLAVVRGYAPEHGTIDHPLTEEHDKMTDRRARQNKPAQEAVTRFRRLARIELPVSVDRYPQTRYSLVEAIPQTGRKHQIRRHLKHIAHPIIGDAKHGKGVHNRFFQEEFTCHRLLLSCVEMNLLHPMTGEGLQLHAALGDSFKRVLERFGWVDSIQS
jgi:tRNA pseudouridine65 synthase